MRSSSIVLVAPPRSRLPALRRCGLVVVLALAACGGSSTDEPPGDTPDAAGRTCDQSLTYTTVNRPPCTWEWTCSDFAGAQPEYSADCVAGNGTDVICECREAGAVTGTMTLTDGCFTIADACRAANAACGFSVPITCAP